MNQQQHAQEIMNAVNAAENDGFSVGIVNDCCGCNLMSLEIGPNSDDWSDPDKLTLILGERFPV